MYFIFLFFILIQPKFLASEVYEEAYITKKILGWDGLDVLAQKEFVRLISASSSFDLTFFSSCEDVLAFLRCNSFCKRFLFKDLVFADYVIGVKFFKKHKFSDPQILGVYILWRTFYLEKYKKDLPIAIFNKAWLFQQKDSLLAKSDFLNWVEWSACYMEFFSRDLSFDDFSALKSFYSFFKERDKNILDSEISSLAYVFGFFGADTVWKTAEVIGFENIHDFKKVLLIFFRWKKKVPIAWINKKILSDLIVANDLYALNGKILSYNHFEGILKRLSLFPSLTIRDLVFNSSSASKQSSPQTKKTSTTINIKTIKTEPKSLSLTKVMNKSNNTSSANNEVSQKVLNTKVEQDSSTFSFQNSKAQEEKKQPQFKHDQDLRSKNESNSNVNNPEVKMASASSVVQTSKVTYHRTEKTSKKNTLIESPEKTVKMSQTVEFSHNKQHHEGLVPKVLLVGLSMIFFLI